MIWLAKLALWVLQDSRVASVAVAPYFLPFCVFFFASAHCHSTTHMVVT
jgi:hypothetical protein